MSRPVHLKVWCGEQLVDTQTLTQDVIKIGRLESSHIRLDSEAVARMHAVIEVEPTGLRVVDLGSSAGTRLNGAAIDRSAPLMSGDALMVGQYRLEIESPALGRAQAPQAAERLTPRAATVARRPAAHVDASEVEHQHAAPVAEVMAVYGETVLDVQHVGSHRRVKRASAGPLLALGGLLLIGGAGFFASETVLRTSEWNAYQTAKTEAAVAGRPAPVAPGVGFGGVGLALGLLGLVPLSLGVARLRESDGSAYTIGEGASASFATPAASLPSSEGFPLVRGAAAGDTTLQFTSDMQGAVVVGDQRFSLEQLVASGQAAANGSAFSYALPVGARCKIQHEGLSFHVNSVAPGKVVTGRSETDKPFWIYNAASVLALGSLLALAHLAMPDAGELSLDDASSLNRFVGYIQQPDEPEEEPEDPTLDEAEEAKPQEAGDPGSRAPGAEGAMGNPKEKSAKKGLYSMSGPKDAAPQMSRKFSPDIAAREAGIIGLMARDSGHFLASPNGGAFAVGNQDADVWGGLVGSEVGSAFGSGGLGLVGTGRQGGGTADGLVGFGKAGLIGKRGSGGDGNGYSHGNGAGFNAKKKRRRVVRASKGIVHGALDKDIVRRIVRNHINEVRHCYNLGLAKDPSLSGRVAVQFSIGATGRVPMAVVANTSVKDKSVGNCVAKAVKRWKFPKPDGGGTVMVTYPFVLNPG